MLSIQQRSPLYLPTKPEAQQRKPCTPTLQKSGVASHGFYLCHLPTVGQWQSLPAVWQKNERIKMA